MAQKTAPRIAATCTRCRARLKVTGSRVATTHRCAPEAHSFMDRMLREWMRDVSTADRLVQRDHPGPAGRKVTRGMAQTKKKLLQIRKKLKTAR